jgi:dTMP kinase
MPGILITFEGGEGTGKSTQLNRLAARLRAAGREVVAVNEPGTTPVGVQIRDLLLHAKEGREMHPRAELLLFAASRAQLMQEVVKPALSRAAVVISDRFTDSTVVYQGVARGLDLAFIHALNAFTTENVRPHLTILFDLDLPTAQARLRRRVRPVGTFDRMEALPTPFFQRVREGYLELARVEPERFRVVNAARRPEKVEEEVWEATRGLFG